MAEDFYTLLPEDEDSADNCPEEKKRSSLKEKDDVKKGLYQLGGYENNDKIATDLALTDFIACYIKHARPGALYTVFRDNERDDTCYQGKPPEDWFGNPEAPKAYLAERRLAHSRRYILIIQSDKPPEEALPSERVYVSFTHNGKWYFISNDDQVSKKNFALVSEFMSIMALPSQAAGPAPTIGVGGSH